MKITSLSSLHALLLHLHQTYSLPHIIITSFSLPASSPCLPVLDNLPAPPQAYQDRLTLDELPEAHSWKAHERLISVASSWTPEAEDKLETTLFGFPLIPGYFSGVGDLFSALTLAHFKSPPTTATDSQSSLSQTATSPSRPAAPTSSSLSRSSSPSPLAEAASRALYSTQQILLSTHLRSQRLHRAEREASGAAARGSPTDGHGSDEEEDGKDRGRRVVRMRRRELAIVGREARADLEGGGKWEGMKVDLLA